jgi:hypothetical protein
VIRRRARPELSRLVFVVRFRPAPGIAAIRNLRRLLKHAGRYYGLKYISAHEERGGR